MSALLLAWWHRRRRRRHSRWALGVGFLSVLFAGAAIMAGGARFQTLSQQLAQCQSGLSGATQPVSLSGSTPAGLTVKGAAASPAQVQAGKVLLGVAAQLHAGGAASTAMIYAAIWESSMTQGGGANYAGYGGILAGLDSAYHGDSVAEAKYFLLGGVGYQAGGAIALSRTVANPVEVAVRVEVPSVWPSNAYASESGYPGDALAVREAGKWVSGLTGLPVSTGAPVACSMPVALGSGGVNPIPEFSHGRDDMGVDGCAFPGAPIFAPAPSQLVEVMANWYAGQPLLLFKFTTPLTGTLHGDQYWFLAEQMTPVTTTIGVTFAAGQPVARFAPSGTCIEIGWGSPTSSGRTLAQQEGDSGAASPPSGALTIWGESFRKFFGIRA